LSDREFQVYTAMSDSERDVSLVNGDRERQAVAPARSRWIAPRKLTVGGKSLEAFPRQFRGEIAEILVYNRSLGTAERRGVESYLGRKYGLPVRE
jgi:hypothetical protein